MPNNKCLVDFANELADQARLITLHYFRSGINHTTKKDNSPVTLADREVEALLREKITSRYPDHSIVGEESAAKLTESEFKWIIDPIDGTKNFISGYPLFGTLISLLKGNSPILSVIDIPAQDERFISCESFNTTYYQGDHRSLVKTKDNEDLGDAILCSTDQIMFNQDEWAQASSLRQAVSIIRYNGDCYLYAMLASGFIDIVLESDLKVYDFIPLIPIVEKSGGVISDWQGNPLNINSNGQVIACSNRLIHQKAIALLNQ